MVKPRVLIVDDDPLVVSLLAEFVESEPWEVLTTCSGSDALEILTTQDIGVAAIDLKMPDMDGLTILKQLQEKNITVPVVIFSGFFTSENVVEVMEAGAVKLVPKTMGSKELMRTLKKYLPGPDDWEARFTKFLNEEYANPDLMLGMLLEHFRISKSYSAILFKRHFGQTFKKQLRQVRVKKAKEMIETTNMSFCQIAEKCGLKTQKRLCEAFQLVGELSPSKYADCVLLGND